MKRSVFSFVLACSLLFSLPGTAAADAVLIPGGQLIGLELSDGTVTVAAFDDNLGAPAREAGLRIGDRIIQIEDRKITCAEDVRNALGSGDCAVTVTVLRGSKQHTLSLTPAVTEQGPRLGVYLRQGISGIGTVTFYDPDTGRFGTLGHGVNDCGGQLMLMRSGSARAASVLSVKKGKSGEPGQLRGTAPEEASVGSLLKNTPQGVFGVSRRGWKGEALPVARYCDVTEGPAIIRSTVSGESVREYSVEILKIYPEDRADCRNFLLQVTDPDLLSATGGIVQGMGVSYNKDNLENP